MEAPQWVNVHNLKIIPATHSYVLKVLKTSAKLKNRKKHILVKLEQKNFMIHMQN